LIEIKTSDMLQHRKKDYLIRLIEELSKKLQQLKDSNRNIDDPEKLSVINDCYTFFTDNFDISKTDNAEELIEKINDSDLLEQYAKLLLSDYEIIAGEKEKLLKALSIIEYLQKTDITFSWERTVLQEDILRLLDEKA